MVTYLGCGVARPPIRADLGQATKSEPEHGRRNIDEEDETNRESVVTHPTAFR
jgi:hypothetical protein